MPVPKLRLSPPAALAKVFGSPPLVGDERPEQYRNFSAAIVSDLQPSSAIDWLYTKDVVDLSWEILRERRIKSEIVRLLQRRVIKDQLRCMDNDPAFAVNYASNALVAEVRAEREANRWLNDSQTQRQVNRKLEGWGYAPETVLAKAYQDGASAIEEIERRIGNAEARRRCVLREIERRNELLAHRLEISAKDVIDAEFTEVKG
jgi:hypothetical protein